MRKRSKNNNNKNNKNNVKKSLKRINKIYKQRKKNNSCGCFIGLPLKNFLTHLSDAQ